MTIDLTAEERAMLAEGLGFVYSRAMTTARDAGTPVQAALAAEKARVATTLVRKLGYDWA